MHQNTVAALIELNSALPAWGIGRTSYYARINAASPTFDPACPTGLQLSDAANAKRYFTAEEVAEYQRALLDRARPSPPAPRGKQNDPDDESPRRRGASSP